MTVLLIDNDPAIVEKNSAYLQLMGCDTLSAYTGREALSLVSDADCVVLETNLPDIDGYTLASRINKIDPVPILFLTSNRSDEDIEKCFSLGSDYLVKPHNLKEMYLRIMAAIKRQVNEGVIQFPPFLIYTHKLMVCVDGEDLLLTPREYAIFMLLYETPKRVVSHRALFKKLWGAGEFSAHLVQQNVSTLRRKLKAAGTDRGFIKTVHGVGYMLELF